MIVMAGFSWADFSFDDKRLAELFFISILSRESYSQQAEIRQLSPREIFAYSQAEGLPLTPMIGG